MGHADWSPDGSRIASADWEGGEVIVWDSASGNEILSFPGHEGGTTCNAWSPDGVRILSTGFDGKAAIWEAVTGEVLLNLFPEDHNSVAAYGAWTKEGRRVVVLSADGIVTVFDPATGEQLSEFFTTSSASEITAFSLSPSGERILIGGHDGVTRVWGLATGTHLLGYEVGGYNWPDYSPDGRWVLIGSTETKEGHLQVFPTWHSKEELIDYAYDCCVFRELTPGERELFGLPER